MNSHKMVAVCATSDIVPNTGVCARVNHQHIAIFRVGDADFYAIDNIDPHTGVSVLSRGLVGNLGDQIVVASPLYKNHINLRTGQGVENPDQQVKVYPVQTMDGQVFVQV